MSKPTIVDVRISDDLNELYCPVCGALICKFDEEVQPKCEHVLFVYGDVTNEFLYASPVCKEVTAEAMKAFEMSTHRSEEEMQLPEEARRVLPKESVDPVSYALEHIDLRKQRSVLCFAATWIAGGGGGGFSTCVAINFDA
jgi:hypothetical protein